MSTKTETVGAEPTITVGGESFKLRRVDTTWGAMRFQAVREKAMKKRPHPEHMDKERFGKDCEKCLKVMEEADSAGGELLTVMYKMLMNVIHPDARAEFVEFMDDPDLGGALEPGELELAAMKAIGVAGGEAELTGDDSEDDPDEGKEPVEQSSTSST